jgi:hypothetical protein
MEYTHMFSFVGLKRVMKSCRSKSGNNMRTTPLCGVDLLAGSSLGCLPQCPWRLLLMTSSPKFMNGFIQIDLKV